jgi:hypothetical protein
MSVYFKSYMTFKRFFNFNKRSIKSRPTALKNLIYVFNNEKTSIGYPVTIPYKWGAAHSPQAEPHASNSTFKLVASILGSLPKLLPTPTSLERDRLTTVIRFFSLGLSLISIGGEPKYRVLEGTFLSVQTIRLIYFQTNAILSQTFFWRDNRLKLIVGLWVLDCRRTIKNNFQGPDIRIFE